MSIDFKGTTTQKELPPVGAHVATLYSIVEFGTMKGEYAGKDTLKRKLRLTWELPEELREFDGEQKPMVVGKTYTASLYEQSKLKPIVVGILGSLTEEEEENFDIKLLLGKSCMLQIAHAEFNGNKYADIVSCTQLPKSMKHPEQINPTTYFDYNEFDEVVYEKLPQWMKDKMADSVEMKERKGIFYEEETPNPADIPF